MNLNKKSIYVAGIETSCDETSIAIIDQHSKLMAHETFSQANIHCEYGGVVPEIAARDHIQKIMPLFERALSKAKISAKELSAIAYTRGPGLSGSLLVGAGIGKSISWALDIPSIGIHHMEAHIMAAMLSERKPNFPLLALLVSGGHTMLVWAENFGEYKVLGTTLDDAVGEAFDKTAKILGLGYPGGPVVSKTATKGNLHRFTFPRPIKNSSDLNMSFSGLKTYTQNVWFKEKEKTKLAKDLRQLKADVCLAFELAAIDCLVTKCKKAIKNLGAEQLVVAGGVSANTRLRKTLLKSCKSMGVKLFLPLFEYCTDNGAMVAQTGLMRFKKNSLDDDHRFSVKPQWSLEDL